MSTTSGGASGGTATAEIVIPARPSPPPPLDVDVASIEIFVRDLGAAGAQVDDLGTFVAGSARVPSWEGDAAVSYHAAIREPGALADAMSLALRRVVRVGDAHAQVMTRLVARRAALVDERAELSRDITQLWQRVRDTDDAGAGTAEASTIEALQDDARRLTRRVRAFETSRDDWVEDVSAEERTMVAALDAAMTLDQVRRRYGGVEDPADRALDTMPPTGASAQEVSAWWASLTPAQRRALVHASPGSIGNRDGVPPGARDEANRVSLARDLHELEMLEDQDLLTRDEEAALRNARAADQALRRMADTVDPRTFDQVPAQLYVYDPDAFGGDGRVAVAVGDLATAQNIAVTVPGLGTDAASAPGLADRAVSVYEAARADDGASSTASMLWIGYDAPDNFVDGVDGYSVVSEHLARQGGERLSDMVDGLRTSREGDPAHITVIGHSYGSTTTGHAATGDGLAADDIVLVGSPGAGDGAHRAEDLGVGDDHVWVGRNSRDAVAMLGDQGWVNLGNTGLGLGNDPSSDDFGAQRFQAEAVDRDLVRPDFWNSLEDHSKYFDHDSESLANIAQIVNADYDDVERAEHTYDPLLGEPTDPEWDRTPGAGRTRQR
ncbi:alpha/beta hydrolase [Nocardioides pacificus]